MVFKELYNFSYGTISEFSEKVKVGDYSGRGVSGLGGSSFGRFSFLVVEGVCEGILVFCGVGIFFFRVLSFFVVFIAFSVL